VEWVLAPFKKIFVVARGSMSPFSPLFFINIIPLFKKGSSHLIPAKNS